MLPTQMSKPTEETETETTMLDELEQPPPEVLVLHEDEEPDTDPLRTLSDTEAEAIYCRLSKSEQKDDCMETRIHHGNDPYSEFMLDNPLTQEEIILSS